MWRRVAMVVLKHGVASQVLSRVTGRPGTRGGRAMFGPEDAARIGGVSPRGLAECADAGRAPSAVFAAFDPHAVARGAGP